MAMECGAPMEATSEKSTLESVLRIDVLNAFEGLQQAFQALSQAVLEDATLPTWIQEASCSSNTVARQFALTQMGLFEYLEHQEPRETVLCVGLIGSSPKTLQIVHHFNEAKLAFKKAILALRVAKIDPLKKMGFARLHLKQCYRTIPLLRKNPNKIRWTWAHTRAIQRITVGEAILLLEKKGSDEGILQQIRRCSQLSPQTPLAIVQELAPHLRANIVYGDKETGYERQMIKAPLPIFFPANKITPLPDYKASKMKELKNEARVIRADTKIDPTPFLPAIRAHRYL